MGQIAGNAAIGAADEFLAQKQDARATNLHEIAVGALEGGASGLAGGKGASYGNVKSIMTSGKQVAKQIWRNAKNGKSIIKPIKNYFKRAHNGNGKFVLSELCRSIAKSTTVSYTSSRLSR